MTTDERPPAQRLLAAAEELFGQRSYGRTAVADICARAGMATGSFYAYYGSKAEIFAAVVLAINADLRMAMKAAMEQADGGQRTRESAGFRAYFEMMSERPWMDRIVRESEFVAPGLFREYYEHLARGYARGVRAAQLAGEVDARYDPEVIAYAYTGIGHFVGMRWADWTAGGQVPEDVLDDVLEFLARGLAPPAGASPRRPAPGSGPGEAGPDLDRRQEDPRLGWWGRERINFCQCARDLPPWRASVTQSGINVLKPASQGRVSVHERFMSLPVHRLAGQRVGYARISGPSQNLNGQTGALTAAGCERIFADTASGKLAERPELTLCLGYLRAGDTLVVWRLDRLGRSLRHLVETVNALAEHGVAFASLHEGIDTSTSTGRLVFHIFAAGRVRAGAHRRAGGGRPGGRAGPRSPGRAPAKLSPEQASLARGRYKDQDVNVAEIATALGAGRGTIYRALQQVS